MAEIDGTLTGDWGAWEAEIAAGTGTRDTSVVGDWGGWEATVSGAAHDHGTPAPAVAAPVLWLYQPDGVTLIRQLTLAVGVQWTDANNDPGSITWRLPLADCADVTAGRIVRVYWQGHARQAARITEWTTELAVDGTRWRNYDQQLGVLAMLGHGVVYPEYGFNRISDDQRTFGFMSSSTFGTAIAGTSSSFVSAYWNRAVGLYMADDGGVRRGLPPEMKSANPAWLTHGTSSASVYTNHGADVVFRFRKLFVTTARMDVEALLAVDDVGSLWIDGQPIIVPEPNEAFSWKAAKSQTFTLSAGTHLIAIKAENRRDNTPIAAAFVLRQLNSKGDPVAPYLVRSSTNGGWLANDGTGPPHWHKAHIVLDLLAENAALGVLGCSAIGAGYTREHDTAGVAFTDRVEKTWAVGTSVLAVLQELGDEGLDFRVYPPTMNLYCWNVRGSDKSATVKLDLGENDGGLKSLSVKTTAPRFNTALMHLDDGTWLQSSDDASVTAVGGKIVQGLSLGSTGDRPSALAAATAMFGETANTIRATTANPSTLVGALAYRDYDVGDYISVPTEDGSGYVKVRVLAITVDASGDVVAAWPEFAEPAA